MIFQVDLMINNILHLQTNMKALLKKQGEKKMKNKQTRISTILFLTIMIASTILVANQPVNAARLSTQPTTGQVPAGVTPNATANVRAFLSFRPNPVGVGQPILINMWTSVAPGAGRMHHDYTLTITKPDGTTEVQKFDTYPNDGTAWTEYIVDQVGTWKFKFDFIGTYFPAGNYLDGYLVNDTTGITTYADSCWYPPASTPEQLLTVQQDMVASWGISPLPTDYWTRPVSMMNREWWPILGNYPNSFSAGNADFAGPYALAPNTAHVVWRRQGDLVGLVGAETGTTSKYEAGIGTNSAGAPNVIYFGRGYETYNKQGVGSVAQCYDIRTGEIFYEIPVASGGITPTFVSYPPSSLGTVVPELMTISGGRLIKINPWTGLVTLNISAYSGVFHAGAYVISLQTNNTATGPRLINWTTTGTSTNFATRVMNNVSFPWSSISLYDFNSGNCFSVSGISKGGSFAQQRVMAASMITGNQLWNITIDEPNFSGSCNVAGEGKIAILSEGGYYVAFDQTTGRQVWKSPQMAYPWDAPAFGAYDVASAYGLIIRSAYSGVYAFNWKDGTIAWKYEAPANPFETPYVNENGTGVYSWNGGILVADGKVYDYNTEHSPTMPITRGWRLHCINASTGAGIWNITAFSGSRSFRGAAADGYLAFDNFYDGYMYVFGKGKSSTTISAPQVAITQGQSIILSGSVLDQSPAQPGTPCVSKESMTSWMEYLHMQGPVPANVVGVPVSLDAVDPNGNTVHIATVTSDMSGTYGFTWKPELLGNYKVTATFAGDDSYGSSWAQTYAAVVEAPAASPTPTVSPPVANPPYEMYTLGTGVAIIIAIAVAVLMLRKRP
jgi:outer membrane protein assembly factor BamB